MSSNMQKTLRPTLLFEEIWFCSLVLIDYSDENVCWASISIIGSSWSFDVLEGHAYFEGENANRNADKTKEGLEQFALHLMTAASPDQQLAVENSVREIAVPQ